MQLPTVYLNHILILYFDLLFFILILVIVFKLGVLQFFANCTIRNLISSKYIFKIR